MKEFIYMFLTTITGNFCYKTCDYIVVDIDSDSDPKMLL